MSKFRKPCVVDIKMGKKTYDPEAGPAKIAKEMTKFPYVEKFGFQFTGMQVLVLHAYICYDYMCHKSQSAILLLSLSISILDIANLLVAISQLHDVGLVTS